MAVHNLVKAEKFSDWNELKCPNCFGDYLHHDTIFSYGRGEDAETGTLVTVAGHVVRVQGNHDMPLNPSPRRGAIEIVFYCEGCDDKAVLSIVQHKGITFMGWRPWTLEDVLVGTRV